MAIPYLSVEVLGLIFQSASKATLKNVRLASRQFNESAKKHLFKAFTLRNTAESAMKLQRILTSPELIRYIRVVHIIPRLGHTVRDSPKRLLLKLTSYSPETWNIFWAGSLSWQKYNMP